MSPRSCARPRTPPTELRDEAERRADARIAEAARAADIRVAAAEEEAAEILAEAPRRGRRAHEAADERRRAPARGRPRRVRPASSPRRAPRPRRSSASPRSSPPRPARRPRPSARKQLGRARELAAEVLADGTEMSHNLRQLSDSLRRNAEMLLRDVGAAHRAMTAKLDEAGVDLGEPPRRARAAPHRRLRRRPGVHPPHAAIVRAAPFRPPHELVFAWMKSRRQEGIDRRGGDRVAEAVKLQASRCCVPLGRGRPLRPRHRPRGHALLRVQCKWGACATAT